MKRIGIGAVIGCICACVCAGEVPENSDKPQPGIETGSTWIVESWGNPGSIERLQSGTRKLLGLNYRGGTKDKTAFEYKPGITAPADKILRVWVYSPDENPPPIAMAISTTIKHIWHETDLIKLRQGWNALSVPLTAPHWKTEASKWQVKVGVEPLNDIRATLLLVYNTSKQSGRLFVEGFAPVETKHDAAIDSEEYWKADRERLCRLGEGYLVWQSNRSGRWRIWKRNLDGSGEMQLSAEEPDRDHFAAHISPDGEHVVYISLPKDTPPNRRIQPPHVVFPIKIVNRDGTGDRVLISSGRTYWGDRCAVWADNETLIYIARDCSTHQFNLKTGEDTTLIPESGNRPWLINASKTFAAQGNPPQFSRYDAKTQRLETLFHVEGCQAYFGHNTPWAVWMNGSGGPIGKVRLDTLEMGSVLEYHDARMPATRNYMYFPMISRCGRLFTFAASPNQHDYWTSDYDIFVAEVDPQTLEVKGRPVRYTFTTSTDTFPDVFAKLPEIGSHSGEAPLTVSFKLPQADLEKGAWEWDFGDGSPAAKDATHTFSQAGEFKIVARLNGQERRGLVSVSPRKAPVALRAVATGDRELRVDFDEPVSIDALTGTLQSGFAVEKATVDASGRSVTLKLQDKLSADDVLHLRGAMDRAQQPNAMQPQQLSVSPLQWPSQRDKLVLVWEAGNQNARNRVLDDKGEMRALVFANTGKAVFDGHYRMQLAGGAFTYAETAPVIQAIKESGEFTFELLLNSESLAMPGERTIAVLGNSSERNLALIQQAGRLHVVYRTDQNKGNELSRDSLGALPSEGPVHVLIRFRAGRFDCLINGNRVEAGALSNAKLTNWSVVPLSIGDGSGARAWQGRICRIALYSRFLSDDEARAQFVCSSAMEKSRQPVTRLEVEATLVTRSKIPTLAEISPYRSALVACEYKVEKVLSGTYTGQTIRVINWGLLDSQPTSMQNLKPGERVKMILEPRSAQPQIKAFYCSDELDPADPGTEYFDVSL
ncbi:MAG TPA: LamG-like jellyroll fold domain-containing protein [Planctomycetota bacterium]|nr:LamG-like jellyroll fold domain-containing protein [Planctomycetota bacterium]